MAKILGEVESYDSITRNGRIIFTDSASGEKRSVALRRRHNVYDADFCKGELVYFDGLETSQSSRGTEYQVATNVYPAESRFLGVMQEACIHRDAIAWSLTEQKEIKVRRENIVADSNGRTYLDKEELFDYSYNDKSEVTRITRVDPGRLLYRHAELTGKYNRRIAEDDDLSKKPQKGFNELHHIERLRWMAEPEEWVWKKKENYRLYEILENYIRYTYGYASLKACTRHATTETNELRYCFNTGLLTEEGDEIMGVFGKNEKRKSQSPTLFFIGFFRRSHAIMNIFGNQDVPIVTYIERADDLIYDPRREVVVDTAHIVDDNKHRLPKGATKSARVGQVQTQRRG